MRETKNCKYCQSEIDKKAKVCPVCKKKLTGKLKYIVIAFIVMGILGSFLNNNESVKTSNDTKDSSLSEDKDKKDDSTVDTGKEDITNDDIDKDTNDDTDTDKASDEDETKDDSVSTTEAYEVTFGAGNYTAGIDFPSGNYDIKAVNGNGNVSSSNMFTGGLNEVMSTTPDDMFIDEFSNAKLDKGVVLKVGGNLTITISSDAAYTKDITTRNNPLTDEVELKSGNYVVGDDFKAGEYDVILVKGNGNVSSSNMYENGLNEIFGSGDDMYIKEFKNAVFNDGDTLQISGVTVKLVPSK